MLFSSKVKSNSSFKKLSKHAKSSLKSIRILAMLSQRFTLRSMS